MPQDLQRTLLNDDQYSWREFKASKSLPTNLWKRNEGFTWYLWQPYSRPGLRLTDADSQALLLTWDSVVFNCGFGAEERARRSECRWYDSTSAKSASEMASDAGVWDSDVFVVVSVRTPDPIFAIPVSDVVREIRIGDPTARAFTANNKWPGWAEILDGDRVEAVCVTCNRKLWVSQNIDLSCSGVGLGATGRVDMIDKL